MAFTPDDIEIKEFVPTLRGYGREEVRAFLRSVAEDVRRLEVQLEEARSGGNAQISAAAPPIAAVPILQPIAPRSAVGEIVAVHGLQSAITDLTIAIHALASRSARDAAPEIATSAVRIARFEEATRVAREEAAQARAFAQPSAYSSDAATAWNGAERRRAGRPWAVRADDAVEHVETARDRENTELLRRMIPLVFGSRFEPTASGAEDVARPSAPQPATAPDSPSARTNVVPITRAVS